MRKKMLLPTKHCTILEPENPWILVVSVLHKIRHKTEKFSQVPPPPSLPWVELKRKYICHVLSSKFHQNPELPTELKKWSCCTKLKKGLKSNFVKIKYKVHSIPLRSKEHHCVATRLDFSTNQIIKNQIPRNFALFLLAVNFEIRSGMRRRQNCCHQRFSKVSVEKDPGWFIDRPFSKKQKNNGLSVTQFQTELSFQRAVAEWESHFLKAGTS